MRPPPEDPIARVLAHLALGLYVAVGTWAVLWIDDDFNDLRFAAASFVAIPTLVLYYAALVFYPTFLQEHGGVRRGILLLVAVTMAPAHVALLNVAGGETSPIKHQSVYRSTEIATEQFRGAFGTVYRLRW